jgi:hypothetical protein
MVNKKELSNPFNIVEFEGIISSIYRIVYFKKDNLKLNNNLKNYKLFKKVNILDLSFIENSLTVFDNFLSYFKSNEYENLINGIATSFEKENAHTKTLLLATHIKEKNINKIVGTKKEIEELNERKKLSIEYAKLRDEIFNKAIQKLKSNKHNHKSVIAYLQNLKTGNLE